MNHRASLKPVRQQAIVYALLSAVSFILNLGLTALLHEVVGLSSFVAVPIAMIVITFFNFCTLKLFIFDQSNGKWRHQLAGFIASIAGFRGVEYLCFTLFHGLFALPYLPVYSAILLASAVCKFVFLRSVLFTNRDKNPPIAQASPS